MPLSLIVAEQILGDKGPTDIALAWTSMALDIAALLAPWVNRGVSDVARDIPRSPNRLFWRTYFLSVEQTSCQAELFACVLPSKRE